MSCALMRDHNLYRTDVIASGRMLRGLVPLANGLGFVLALGMTTTLDARSETGHLMSPFSMLV